MSNEELLELEMLQKTIRANTAELSDYERYKALLLANGITQARFQNVLEKSGFYSLEQYYKQRKRAKNATQKHLTEGAVLGALLGMGEGLQMYWRLEYPQSGLHFSSQRQQRSGIQV